MIGKKIIRSDTIQKKYLVSFFTIALLVDLLVSFLLCCMYSFFQFHKTTNASIAQMKQVCVSTDLLYETMEAIVTQVQTDPDTKTFLNSSTINRLQERNVGSKIRSIRTANPSIRYITLYNSDTSRFVSTAAAGNNEVLDTETLYKTLGDHTSACCFRSIGMDTNIQTKKNSQVYTFLFAINKKASQPGDLVIIDVNANYFDKAIAPICVKEADHIIILQSGNEDVISVMESSRGVSAFTATAGNDLAMADLSAGKQTEDSGYYYSKYEGSLKFTLFASAIHSGWVIYSFLPPYYPFEGLERLLLATLLLSAISLGVGFALSSSASQTLYAPIKRLYVNYVSPGMKNKTGNELDLINDAFHEIYSKTDRLEQGLVTAYRENRNLYLNYLLLGEKHKVEASLQAYERLEIRLSSPHYAIILIECIPKQTVSVESAGDLKSNQFINNYALDSMIQELFTPLCATEFLQTDENRFTLMLYLDTPVFPEEMTSVLDKVSQTMQQNFSLDTTICIGRIVSAWRDINLSYEQSLIALSSHTVEHYGKVFYSQSLPESVDINAKQYFNGLDTRLTELIRNDNLEECAKEFDFALISTQSTSFRSVRSLLRHVLMSVLDNFPDTFKKDNDVFMQMIKQIEKIDHCHNVQSLKETSLSFLALLNIHVHASRKNKNLNIAQRARDYIDQNYADPNLTLQTLSEIVNCSPAYLGKTFTSVTTFTFNDYLNQVRMGKAAELLTSTKHSISQISEEVGILNSNYFYSLFKKRYGLTPSVYRKQPPS